MINQSQIKQILESEIKRHKSETKRHKFLYEKTTSKKEKEKATKHFHKLFQTKLIAKELGLEFCEYCGSLK